MLTWEQDREHWKALEKNIDWEQGPFIVLRGIFMSVRLRDIIYEQSQRVCPVTIKETISDYD